MVRPARPAGPDRERRASLALAGGVALLAGAASVARSIGVTEAAAGGGLALASAFLFAAAVARQMRARGMSIAKSLAWRVALVVAAAAPLLLSLFPGRLVAEATIARAGDGFRLAPGLHGPVRVLVSAPLPEGSRLGFSLRLGPEALEGTLRRGATWWRAGEERRHYHEDRRSVLMTGHASTGVEEVVLKRVTGTGVPLAFRFYAQELPPWLVTIFSIVTATSFAFLHGRIRRTRFPAAVAAVSVSSGVLGSMIARPDDALGPVLAGVVAGTLIGVLVSHLVGELGRMAGRGHSTQEGGSRRPQG